VVSRKMLCKFIYLSALLHHHIEHCQFSIYQMLLKLLTETEIIFYIFIDMLTGAKKKKSYCSVVRHFKSVSDYILDILLSIFRSCFMCPYCDKCCLPFSVSENPICAEKIHFLTGRLM